MSKINYLLSGIQKFDSTMPTMGDFLIHSLMEGNDPHQYDDIIELPHHVSQAHPHMPVSDRTAQFSLFAALIGYDAAIRRQPD